MQQHWKQSEVNILTREYQKGASYKTLLKLLEGRTYNAIDKQVRNLNLLRKHEKLVENKKVGHLDIEASQLNASFGFIISWAIKEDGKDNIIGDRLTKKDFAQKDKLQTDKRIVQSLVEAMEDFDIITHFFGDYFDIPFVRSRCLKHGLYFPDYGSIATIDCWKWSKRNMKLHSHRLDAVAGHLGANSKTKLEPDTWSRGTMGDLKAIEEIWEHNRQDVITLEKVYHRLKPYSNGSRRSI